MPTQPNASKICLRCGRSKAHPNVWHHPDIEEKVVVWIAVCDGCLVELVNSDFIALDIIKMESVLARHEKDYDFSE